jgi:hypothetical protein
VCHSLPGQPRHQHGWREDRPRSCRRQPPTTTPRLSPPPPTTIGSRRRRTATAPAPRTTASPTPESAPLKSPNWNARQRVVIASGDTTPSLADHTDFGPAAVLGPAVTRTFTLFNTGTATLTLTGPTPITFPAPCRRLPDRGRLRGLRPRRGQHHLHRRLRPPGRRFAHGHAEQCQQRPRPESLYLRHPGLATFTAEGELPVRGGLLLHLDAGALTGYGNGDPVSLWPDLSGLSHDGAPVGTNGTPPTPPPPSAGGRRSASTGTTTIWWSAICAAQPAATISTWWRRGQPPMGTSGSASPPPGTATTPTTIPVPVGKSADPGIRMELPSSLPPRYSAPEPAPATPSAT